MLGALKLSGTTISKLLKITGNLNATGAHLHEIVAEGDVKLTDSVLDQTVRVIGSFQASGCQFHSTLHFTGQKVLLSNCTLSGITFQRDAAFKAKQVLELKNGTQINGPVLFEGGGGGEVHLYPGSKVRGSVSGGKIIPKN